MCGHDSYWENTQAHVSTWRHTWQNVKYNWLFGANLWLNIKSLWLSQNSQSHDPLEVWFSSLSPPSLVFIYNRPDWATVSWVVELKSKKGFRVIFTLCVFQRNWAWTERLSIYTADQAEIIQRIWWVFCLVTFRLHLRVLLRAAKRAMYSTVYLSSRSKLIWF